MYESLFNYIKQHSKSPISADDEELIKKSFLPRGLKKKELFLEQGSICNYTGFILKGAMRQYSVDDSGTEHIIQLAIENWWMVDRESFLMKTPSVYNIDAWENTELLVLSLENLERIHTIDAIKEMFWQMNQSNFIASQKRLNYSISLPALERYEELVKNYPDFVQRFPQHTIASYLGISKETLSRVRNKYVHK
ncbi:Crp/Fnr family transcriptional regulator [Pedobacter rhizosphaerae]|uniref:cAMP-binding domain of CRP or a regulatory subunit of cAMP-dependent protein kinases n=1 Tax=Pedobacter rhizosphaerae TaxID=390241 RepID=A0A1H9SL78_9SPHI|nr:Crp/Fnr family transcriptional regulator [Pedobacter rhizosphaerae]SER85780.1 cAMP-binding domain of CRP or a regulatory subunit of cAMP-dependent protein kinases [Pedobacter rhizosphaerae]